MTPPPRVHPDPLVRVFPDLVLDGFGRCRGKRERIAIAITRARSFDPANHDPMHTACQSMGASEQQGRPEMRCEVAGGPRRERGASEEGSEAPGRAPVQTVQDPEDA